MRIDKEEHRTALLDFIDQIAENVAFPDYFDKEVAELRAAIREAKIEEQDRIAVLERERDALREALKLIVANTEPDAIKHIGYDGMDAYGSLAKDVADCARAALEARP